MSIEKLYEKAKEFSLSDEIIEELEKKRLSFVEKFPLNELKNLSMDQYVLGTDKNSFCYWLEFKKIGFGIGGGNSSKFGIYKAKDGNYYTGYRKSKKQLSEQELDDFFSNIKSGIIQALEYTQNDAINKIHDIDLPIWNMVLQKILSLYYPDKFLHISLPQVLLMCANELGISNIKSSPNNLIQVNYECKKEISSKPIFSNWPYEKITTFIWEFFDGENVKTKRKHHKQLEKMRVDNSQNANKENALIETDKNFSLNTIFYGPPGTGKTYNAILRAAEIIENRKIDSYDEALEIFKANLHDQIEFITFHQNYSYEDFIQGLRPDTENDKELTFERKDGIFKVIADRALKNIRASEQPTIAKRQFDESFNEFIGPLVEGEDDEIEVQMKNTSYFITSITNKSIEFRRASGSTYHTLSISTLKKMYDAESILDIRGRACYYSPLLSQLLKIGKDPSGKKEIVQRKNYVIIIDEINRANISRVFGELITLIEPDKRSHGKIPMEAKLPSGDTFVVPSNLYIIGTMNTADKSIALLDIALRRRFEFEPMYPKYSEDGLNIEDENVLKSINESIISDKGHDFQIGHSYFMDSGEDPYDFKRRMNVKVIPLLLEYFMNDYKAVTQIISKALSETRFSVDDKSWPLRITEKND